MRGNAPPGGARTNESTSLAAAAALPRTARLFLALWPGPAARAALAAWRDAWAWPPGARPVPTERLHLTLHFIGPVPRERVAPVADALDVPATSFELAFGRAERWRHGLAVLRPLGSPPQLEALHAALAERLRACDLPVETRPFRAHVTMAREAPGVVPPVAGPALRWRVRGHALVESRPGRDGGYVVLRRYTA
jgi:2'-5' RNA ligase